MTIKFYSIRFDPKSVLSLTSLDSHILLNFSVPVQTVFTSAIGTIPEKVFVYYLKININIKMSIYNVEFIKYLNKKICIHVTKTFYKN